MRHTICAPSAICNHWQHAPKRARHIDESNNSPTPQLSSLTLSQFVKMDAWTALVDQTLACKSQVRYASTCIAAHTTHQHKSMLSAATHFFTTLIRDQNSLTRLLESYGILLILLFFIGARVHTHNGPKANHPYALQCAIHPAQRHPKPRNKLSTASAPAAACAPHDPVSLPSMTAVAGC